MALIVAAISSLFCVLLVALLFAISDESTKESVHVKSDDVIDLLASPSQHDKTSADINSTSIGIELPKGGWVQQTDKQGKLVQQYRCDHLDPDPPGLSAGWIEMRKPEVELFLGDNKLIRITGNSGIANAPNRILESGEIDGNVIVKMFELDAMSNNINPIPLMQLHTEVAKFDNFIGEITCPSQVAVQSPSQSLLGTNLSVRFNDVEERIEFLRLEELEYIEIYPTTSQTVPATLSSTNTSPYDSAYSGQNRVRAAAAGNDYEYYIVTISENVQVLQGTQLDGRLARGENLTLAFSNKSKSMAKAQHSVDKGTNTMLNTPTAHAMSTILATSVLANTQPTLNELPVRITCDGGMTMVPLHDPARIPSLPTDTRLELFAFEDTPAQLIDISQNMTAQGELIRYEVNADRSDLFGEPATLLFNDTLTSSNHLWVSRQDAAGGASGAGTMQTVADQQLPTTLRWSEGVDFTFDSTDEHGQGSLEQVVCHGNVELLDQGNTLTCSTLTVDFEQDSNGNSSPSIASATGGVKAVSESQKLWANEAEVTFKNGSIDNEHADSEESMFGGSHADSMFASGNVQVLLSDGGRAFCENLEGHITQDRAILNGNVVIAYERMLMNRGDEATLSLNRATGKGNWSGAGQALFLNELLDVSPDRRIERPTIKQPTVESEGTSLSMRANWQESMNLDQNFNDGAGAIDLKGNVQVKSQRSEEERSQMSGEDLRLEFTQDSADNKRVLHKTIAKNNAQIEHRTWDVLSPNLPPVVYYIGGNHVEFDSVTSDALVVGNGELVLRDPRQPANEIHQSALAGRGTTRFTWENKLQTTHLQGNVYRVEMTGNVEMVHKGLDGAIGMLTSDRIEALAVDPKVINPNSSKGAELTLRGMDLQELNANGNVYVATETRRVDCDAFEYNLRTGFASLSAEKNRSVAVVTEGTPYPVRASSVVWNMDPAVDTISIRGLQGTGNN